MTFFVTQNISTFKSFSKKINEIRNAKSRTGSTKKERLLRAMEPLKHSVNRLEN